MTFPPSELRYRPGDVCIVRPRGLYSTRAGLMHEPPTEHGRIAYTDFVARGTAFLVVASVDHGYGEDVLALLPGYRIGWLFGEDVVLA